MNTIRSGKIARLPPEIREQLNQRLANHESSTSLVKWLNALPEVQAVVTQEFGGKAVMKQNLHEWRHGGHAEWRWEQAARKIVERLHADSNELTKVADGSVANITAQWLAARYVVGLKQLKGRAGDREAAWNQMRECCHDVLALRRMEHLAQRLEFERVRAGLKFEDGGLKMEGECKLTTGKSPAPAGSKAVL
ncbi:MAG: hypothetical protein P4N60_02790 [Verrucomicrobiae bacterium]|nr:hypothetical protein [Verrucomicrobiae bacterium]